MTLARWTAVATLAVAFHLQAQSPAPTPPPVHASGPTMEQTIAFINDAFTKEGNVSYKVKGLKRDFTVILKGQAISPKDVCTLSYEYRATKLLDGREAGGAVWVQRLLLDLADPRTIAVVPMGDTDPDIFRIVIKQNGKQPFQSADGEDVGFKPDIELGYFFDKDQAQPVAKAYIHAMVLCHKPEAPSLF